LLEELSKMPKKNISHGSRPREEDLDMEHAEEVLTILSP
jgi:hypothetical protein